MSDLTIVTSAEAPSHDAEIEAIHAATFGPGRFARAAFRIREGGPHDPALSRVAELDGEVIASVRLTPIVIGKTAALLLGPLAVKPDHMNKGIGRKLMQECLTLAHQQGHALVLLVGDVPYYGPFGFKRVARGSITFPAPVDPNRILLCELTGGASEGVSGAVKHAGS